MHSSTFYHVPCLVLYPKLSFMPKMHSVSYDQMINGVKRKEIST